MNSFRNRFTRVLALSKIRLAGYLGVTQYQQTVFIPPFFPPSGDIIMPIHLPPINRRRFLAGTLAAGAGLLLPREILAKEPATDPNLWVLMADIHIPKDRQKTHRGIKPTENLSQAIEEILSLSPRPAGVIVAGDCAIRSGISGDYAMLGELIKPLRQAGVPMHFALGNHDHRERFLAAFPEAKKRAEVDPHELRKFVSVLKTPHADWFLLDSLSRPDKVAGRLGEAQLAWFAKTLDARPERPTLVVAHHNLDREGKAHSLKDTAALFKMILPRKKVKAYFYGHTHCWNIGREEGMHLVNIPGNVWLFDKSQPRGFVTVQLRPDRATFEMHSLDRTHPKHGEKIELKWRV